MTQMSKMEQFENYMADVKTRSVAKRAALAAWWFIENVTREDPESADIWFVVRQYLRMMQD